MIFVSIYDFLFMTVGTPYKIGYVVNRIDKIWYFYSFNKIHSRNHRQKISFISN